MRHTDAEASAPSPIRRPLLHCPACGSADLDAVVESVVHEVHYLCRACAGCWDVALGAVQRVAPSHCLGCAQRGRCTRAYAADHPAPAAVDRAHAG